MATRDAPAGCPIAQNLEPLLDDGLGNGEMSSVAGKSNHPAKPLSASE